MSVPSVNEVRGLVQRHTENLYNEAVTVFGYHGHPDGPAMTDDDVKRLTEAQATLTQALMERYQRKGEVLAKRQAEADEAKRALERQNRAAAELTKRPR